MKKAFLVFGILVVAFLSIYAITKRPFSVSSDLWTAFTIGPRATFEDSTVHRGNVYMLGATDTDLDAGTFGNANFYLDFSTSNYGLYWNYTGSSLYFTMRPSIATARGLKFLWDTPTDSILLIDPNNKKLMMNANLYSKENRTNYESYIDFSDGLPELYFHWASPYYYTNLDSTILKLYGQNFQMRKYNGGANDTIVDINVSTKQMKFDGKIRSVDSRLGNVSYLDLRYTHVGLNFIWQYKYARFDSTRADLLGMPFTVGSYQGSVDTTFMVSYATGVVLKNGCPTSPQQGSTYYSFSGTADPDTGWAFNGSTWAYTLYQH